MSESVGRSGMGNRLFRSRSNRGRGEKELEYSADDIKKKFEAMPRLNKDEKAVLKSSWQLIMDKMDTVSRQIRAKKNIACCTLLTNDFLLFPVFFAMAKKFSLKHRLSGSTNVLRASDLKNHLTHFLRTFEVFS